MPSFRDLFREYLEYQIKTPENTSIFTLWPFSSTKKREKKIQTYEQELGLNFTLHFQETLECFLFTDVDNLIQSPHFEDIVSVLYQFKKYDTYKIILNCVAAHGRYFENRDQPYGYREHLSLHAYNNFLQDDMTCDILLSEGLDDRCVGDIFVDFALHIMKHRQQEKAEIFTLQDSMKLLLRTNGFIPPNLPDYATQTLTTSAYYDPIYPMYFQATEAPKERYIREYPTLMRRLLQEYYSLDFKRYIPEGIDPQDYYATLMWNVSSNMPLAMIDERLFNIPIIYPKTVEHILIVDPSQLQQFWTLYKDITPEQNIHGMTMAMNHQVSVEEGSIFLS